jgi:hypothetical protein
MTTLKAAHRDHGSRRANKVVSMNKGVVHSQQCRAHSAQEGVAGVNVLGCVAPTAPTAAWYETVWSCDTCYQPLVILGTTSWSGLVVRGQEAGQGGGGIGTPP